MGQERSSQLTDLLRHHSQHHDEIDAVMRALIGGDLPILLLRADPLCDIDTVDTVDNHDHGPGTVRIYKGHRIFSIPNCQLILAIMPSLVLETNVKVIKYDSVLGGACPLSGCRLPM